jgi:hypothetical protein
LGINWEFKDTPQISRGKDTLVGIEIEVEKYGASVTYKKVGPSKKVLFDDLASNIHNVWKNEHDGSLRNHGMEFYTTPIAGEHVGISLRMLELLFKFYANSEVNYRCGTHVHIDVREFTVAQLINFCILYILFEDTLYSIAGMERKKNIYCVPVRSSGGELEPLFHLLHVKNPTYKQLRSAIKKFKKYMAFNICPIGNYTKDEGAAPPLGTIEFRHHEGCSDPLRLTQWVKILLALHTAAKTFTYEEIKDFIFEMNTRSNYLEFAAKVFGERITNKDWSNQDLVNDMYRGSLFVKELYISSKGS